MSDQAIVQRLDLEILVSLVSYLSVGEFRPRGKFDHFFAETGTDPAALCAAMRRLSRTADLEDVEAWTLADFEWVEDG